MTTPQQSAHLFTLRLWPEVQADGRIVWRGKLHHVQSNEIRYFQDWPALLPSLLAMLPQAALPMPDDSADDSPS